MARNFPRNRQGLPAGSVVGRLNGTGSAQVISLAQAIQQALQSGTIPLPASGPFTSAVLDALFGTTEGAIIQRGPSVWQALAPGTVGQVLKSGGAGALNSWAAGGTVVLTNQGAWNGTNAYNPGDVVTYNGSAYLDYVAIAAAVASAQQWDTADHTGMTLSTTTTTNDTAVSQAVSNANTQGNVPETAGKWYFEFVCSNLLDNGTTVGIAQTALAANFGGNALGVVSGGMAGHGTGSFAGLTNNKRGAVAVDLTNKLFWITADVTVAPINWNGSTSNSPGGGVGGLTITTGAIGTMHPSFYSPTSANQKCILHSQSADFLIPAIPSGFSAWSGSTTPNTSPDQDSAHWVGRQIPIDNLFSYEHLGGI